jgi:hypothetical protein
MGQFLLGIRSLLVKAAVFVVLAALLAWALGGTLWPRATVIDLDTHPVSLNGRAYFWRVAVAQGIGRDGLVIWTLMATIPGTPRAVPVDDREWVDGAGPVVAGSRVWFGGLEPDGRWALMSLEDGTTPENILAMPDRLAVEQQLSRLAAGLPVQDERSIRRQRGRVLDPPDQTADGKP